MGQTKTVGAGMALMLAAGTLTAFTSGAHAADSLPIIPGAAGFGMETPAGSGRHLMTASLGPGGDASMVGHWDFDDETAKDGVLVGTAVIVKRDTRDTPWASTGRAP